MLRWFRPRTLSRANLPRTLPAAARFRFSSAPISHRVSRSVAGPVSRAGRCANFTFLAGWALFANSGAPHCSGGKYSPRGSRTYLPANEFPGTASKVIEVMATGEFALPINVVMSFDLGLTWKPLQNTGQPPCAAKGRSALSQTRLICWCSVYNAYGCKMYRLSTFRALHQETSQCAAFFSLC